MIAWSGGWLGGDGGGFARGWEDRSAGNPGGGEREAREAAATSAFISCDIKNYSGTSNKGHFGANSLVPCREVVPISEVK